MSQESFVDSTDGCSWFTHGSTRVYLNGETFLRATDRIIREGAIELGDESLQMAEHDLAASVECLPEWMQTESCAFRGRMKDPIVAAFWAGVVCWAWQKVRP